MKNKNYPLELRPKCKIVDIDIDSDTIISKIQQNLETGKDIVVGNIDYEQQHIELRVPKSQRHYWSPALHVWLESNNDTTSVSCVLGPNNKIWNTFIVFYSIAILFTIAGLILGIYQKINHQEPYYFWIVPLGLVLILGINFAARIGQYWGKTQSQQLKGFLSMIINKKV